MKNLTLRLSILLCAAVFTAPGTAVAEVHTTPPVNAPVVEYDTSAPLTGTPVVVTRAQITGLSGPVVTVVHPEGKRQVYDPIIVADETQIWLGTHQVTPSTLHLKQYLKIAGFKDGDIITAGRIDIITGGTKVPPKKVIIKIKPKPKPKVKPKTTS